MDRGMIPVTQLDFVMRGFVKKEATLRLLDMCFVIRTLIEN